MRTIGGAWSIGAGLVLVGVAYALSFFLPALAIPVLRQPALERLKTEVAARTRGGEVIGVEGPPAVVISGYECFRSGWSAEGLHRLAWWANPVLWVGCLLLPARRRLEAALAGCVALGLGLTMAFVAVIGDPRADVRWSVGDYRAGYWLWLASMALLAVAGAVAWWTARPRPASAGAPQPPAQPTGGA